MSSFSRSPAQFFDHFMIVITPGVPASLIFHHPKNFLLLPYSWSTACTFIEKETQNALDIQHSLSKLDTIINTLYLLANNPEPL